MASTSFSFFFFFLLVSSLALEAAAARDLPSGSMMQPQMSFDSSVWVPGLGRFMLPKKGTKSLDYNPITGSPGGNGVSIPGFEGSGGSRSSIPGGDDTFVPNPGMEVPNPSGGGLPAPSSPWAFLSHFFCSKMSESSVNLCFLSCLLQGLVAFYVWGFVVVAVLCLRSIKSVCVCFSLTMSRIKHQFHLSEINNSRL